MASATAAAATPQAACKVSAADSRASRTAPRGGSGAGGRPAAGSGGLGAGERVADGAAQLLTSTMAPAEADREGPTSPGARLGWLGSGAAGRAVLQQQQQQQQQQQLGRHTATGQAARLGTDTEAHLRVSAAPPAVRLQPPLPPQQQLMRVENQVEQLGALWEHLCMAHVDFDAFNTICRCACMCVRVAMRVGVSARS